MSSPKAVALCIGAMHQSVFHRSIALRVRATSWRTARLWSFKDCGANASSARKMDNPTASTRQGFAPFAHNSTINNARLRWPYCGHRAVLGYLE